MDTDKGLYICNVVSGPHRDHLGMPSLQVTLAYGHLNPNLMAAILSGKGKPWPLTDIGDVYVIEREDVFIMRNSSRKGRRPSYFNLSSSPELQHFFAEQVPFAQFQLLGYMSAVKRLWNIAMERAGVTEEQRKESLLRLEEAEKEYEIVYENAIDPDRAISSNPSYSSVGQQLRFAQAEVAGFYAKVFHHIIDELPILNLKPVTGLDAILAEVDGMVALAARA